MERKFGLMTDVNKEELLEELKSGYVEIQFRKKDGTERSMIATLQEHHLPEIEGTAKPKPDYLITVYDVENDGWRSIILDSILHLNYDFKMVLVREMDYIGLEQDSKELNALHNWGVDNWSGYGRAMEELYDD